jgi:hypothetical protein
MSKTIVIIEDKECGQPRPYADSFYSGYISARCEGVLTDGSVFYFSLQENKVKELARLFIREFKDDTKGWWEAKLLECRPVGPTEEMIKESHPKYLPKKESRWFVRLTEAFTD